MVKRFLQYLFNKTGFYVAKRPRYHGNAEFEIDQLSYAPALPYANYAPWNNDKNFLQVLKIIKEDFKHTLVDKYRAYELWQMAAYAIRLNPGLSFLEVGVWRGGTAAIMAKAVMQLQADNVIYLADTFEGVANAGNQDDFYKGGEHQDTSENLVRDLLTRKMGFHNYKILKGIFPEQTQQYIPLETKFSCCHIDVDVYQSAKEVLEWVWPRLAVKGIVVFDDYGFHTCTGITKLVEGYRLHTDRIIIHNLNGHAVMLKLA